MARPAKYPIQDLEPGDSVIIPWLHDAFGRRLTDQGTIRRSIQQYAKRSGKTFLRAPEVRGVRVTRVS